ncbi:MAG: hypothetical protein KDA69_03145 [Planctomycetaceae bacterium]|nr:hypothetical protein [Planctomycetaceae bacterium]
MRTTAFMTILALVLLSRSSFGLLESKSGNAPLAAANYTDWPGLVDAINDESRVFTVWCNGGETFDYAGDIDALNRVLAAFGKTKVPKLEVVVIPSVDELIPPENPRQKVDWRVEICGGIVQHMVIAQELEPAWNLHPTLTVYASSDLDLKAIRIPENVVVTQRDEIRTRLQDAAQSDNKTKADRAKQLLKILEPDMTPDQRLKFERRVADISIVLSKKRAKQ